MAVATKPTSAKAAKGCGNKLSVKKTHIKPKSELLETQQALLGARRANSEANCGSVAVSAKVVLKLLSRRKLY